MRSEIQSHPIQQWIHCICTAYTHIHWIQPLKPASIYLVVNFNSAQPSQNRDWGSSNLPTLAVLQYNFHFGRKSICPTRICKKKVDMIFGVPSALGFWCYLDLCQDIITVKGQICFFPTGELCEKPQIWLWPSWLSEWWEGFTGSLPTILLARDNPEGLI